MIDRLRRLGMLDVALLLAMAALVAVIVWLATILTADDQWKPLGPFPEQTVTNPASYDWPTAGEANVQPVPAVGLANGVVYVEATKCYRETVTVNGAVAWQVLDPPGRTYETGRGTAVKEQGCSTSSFENEVPVDLAAFVADRGEPVVVAITGCETPTDPDRGEGASLCWSTEPFALIP